MATLAQLVGNRFLVGIGGNLSWREQKCRCLYGAPGFVDWCRTGLLSIPSTIMGGRATPLEQIEDLFHQFVSGGFLGGDRRFKKLHSVPESFVWEMKTPELRLFGWVPKKDHFILVAGDSADHVKHNGSYEENINAVIEFRNQLDLDKPKYVNSTELNNVVSD